MGYYRNAAICINGHVESTSAELTPATPFCDKCGGKVITDCPSCQKGIRGYYYVEGVISFGDNYSPPSFCFNCGKPFPWTAAKIAAGKELADEIENLSGEDRDKLKQALEDVSSDGPRTSLGAARLKKLLGNATSAVGKAAWKIAIEVATETAKKTLLG
jgi:hypothetical protein